MNADSINAISLLKETYTSLHLRNGVDWERIPNKDSTNRYVQYHQICEGVHFEVYRFHQQLYVAFHDERNDHNEEKMALRSRITAIADAHADLLGKEDNGLYHRTPIDSRMGFEDVRDRLQDVLRDLFDLLLPALQFGESESSIDKFSPPDMKVSKEVMRLLKGADQCLTIDGSAWYPLKSSDNSEEVVCYKRWFDGAVYYQVRREHEKLFIELVDNRSLPEPDALVSNLYHIAKEKGFIIKGLDCSKRVVSSDPVSCCKPFRKITEDIEEQLTKLHSLYDQVLINAEEKGVDSLHYYSINLTPMKPIVPPEQCDDATKLAELILETFTWVTTIDDLFNKRVITLQDDKRTRIISGQYVIPDYQRKYSWTADNVRTLCRDLLHSSKIPNGRNYHLGTIILHAEKNMNIFYVVDGQQRLRTVSRLLSREFFDEGNGEGRPFCQSLTSDETTILDVLNEYSEDDKQTIIHQLEKSTLVCIAVSNLSESFQLFSTQNGRGKELSPSNLLKAFHFHELEVSEGKEDTPDKVKSLNEIDEKWESANVYDTQHDGQLLSELLGEHLYRVRCWIRGVFPKEKFSAKSISAFKGVTVAADAGTDENIPLQNLSLLRSCFEKHGMLDNVQPVVRSINDKMDPFVTIDQPIVNGRDFFTYVDTYVEAYRRLFDMDPASDDLSDFRQFYRKHCLYKESGRRGDQYARHIYQSLCLICYDRFGKHGLINNQRELFRCAYFERATKSRCYYGTCGERFVVEAVRSMFGSFDTIRLGDELHELGRQARNEYRVANRKNMPSGLAEVNSVYDYQKEQ